MQGFAGISLFSVLLLMALGLAIIFGQMGVINMAHGEFMA
ncbi:MAG: urea ABC transporter permease subunit UrtB, partial [Thioalkalispiraceae bacterium]